MTDKNMQSSSAERKTMHDIPATKIWLTVLRALKAAVGRQDYQKWIVGLEVVAEVDGEILLAARDDLQEDRVRQNFIRVINSAWGANDPRGRKVVVKARSQIDTDLLASAPAFRLVGEERKARMQAAAEAQTVIIDAAGAQRMLRDQSFETLIVGDANRTAANLLRAVASGEAPPAGCITLFGRHGVGKTHHLKALAQALKDAGKGDEFIYITAQEFLTAYINGAQAKNTSDLKARVRGARIVMFDDLHVICGKTGTEREFWESLREITAPDETGRSGYVIIASDAPPNEVSGLSPRIRSELLGGMVIELGMPDVAMMRQIVERKVALLRNHSDLFDLTEDMVDRIVFAVDDGPRVLTGVLCSIYSESVYAQRAVGMDAVEAAIHRHVGRPVEPSIDEIKRAVSEVTGVSKAVIEGKSRQRPHALARHIAMYIVTEMTQKTLPQIARQFGDKHHTTVMNGRDKLTALLASQAPEDAEQRLEVKRIIDRCLVQLREIVANRPKPAAA